MKRLAGSLDMLLSEFGPEYRYLSPEVVKEHFLSLVIAGNDPNSLLSRIKALTPEEAENLSTALYHAYIYQLDYEPEEFKYLAIDQKQREALTEHLKSFFGPERITEVALQGPRFRQMTFSSYVDLVQYISDNAAEIFLENLLSMLPEPREEAAVEAQSNPPSPSPATGAPKQALLFGKIWAPSPQDLTPKQPKLPAEAPVEGGQKPKANL